ncbi:chromosome segregation protein ParM [Streptomyces sp. SR27]|uniref:chromosome segregation protein ParM n=1 Tax=Streptomyces sp. SR27 TaxID=3076630 RepID=UPI00295A90CB|nr:chromosome segregation protein ParM [Streptomyces sp. SR27]MDV9188187.1 chromosome segregation protein ParM [Streptomyces sp. SR27]
MFLPRSVALERLAYTLAAPALALVPNLTPDGPANIALLLPGVLGAGNMIHAATSRLPGSGQRIIRSFPLALATGVDLAAVWTPGYGPMQTDVLLAAGWALFFSALAPLSRTGRRGHRPAAATALPAVPAAPVPAALPAPAEPVKAPLHPEDGAPLYTRSAREVWERAGLPGGTLLVKAIPHPDTARDLTILLRSKDPGRPIRSLSAADVAAAFAVYEEEVALAPVEQQKDGRQGGPGWLQAHITPDATARRAKTPTLKERWADRVAGPKGGAPGTEIVDRIRDKERGVTFYRGRMVDETEVPQIDLAKVCRGLGIPADDSCVFVILDGHEFLISVFDTPPLSQMFPASRELLTPDEKGMYTCGYTTTGQPVKNMVFQHDKNAARHGLTLGVSRSGKTQFFAIDMAAMSLAGQVVWLGTVRKDEKTSTLGRFIDRQGSNALWMARSLRAARALCDIRAEMPWPHDGQPHDYKPGDPRCPYRQLNVFGDEFMTCTKDEEYGEFIQIIADDLTVTGLKYGVGFNPAGQSPFAHDGFSSGMKANLRQNSRAVVFNMGNPSSTRKAVEGTMENAHDVPTIPTRYSQQEGSVIERAMRGEADPENGVSTGGVAVIVLDNGRAVLMRSLYADFDTDLASIFPDEVVRLTDYEISELDKRGLWFDWNEPERPGEFHPAPDDDGDGDGEGPRRRGGGGKPGRKPREEVTSARQALEAIKTLVP